MARFLWSLWGAVVGALVWGLALVGRVIGAHSLRVRVGVRLYSADYVKHGAVLLRVHCITGGEGALM